ncbi:alfa-l-rhamnosidase [Lactobacillus acidophilus NCFM] [Lactiplantibacillus mudanjiangensis]|uniref:alpha-L-rhamnosidase n=1 Tax=Lactiplantibacillus mudanjiangensis TaxID=1296538 RepID=UPI00101441A1|nr:alpha-L-rhamnosidase [Lactiplantibacillus mudanjiangensis]VDG32072.1 alfa-l-rhamnosidase [Lactobacillus acidophilus NCFM] [Lactiplantibacillus mudanjiangensis]
MSWITKQQEQRHPLQFEKTFTLESLPNTAIAKISSIGNYVITVNGQSVTDMVLTPGYTSFRKRLQYQTIDIVNALVKGANKLVIEVGGGWQLTKLDMDIHWLEKEQLSESVYCDLSLNYADHVVQLMSDETWQVSTSQTEVADLYGGEVTDYSRPVQLLGNAEKIKFPYDQLVPQTGPDVTEMITVFSRQIITTPKGECVIDFGQNLTGYVEINGDFVDGQHIDISHAEVLDVDGNFYNANYRGAKSQLSYVTSAEVHTLKPKFTFFGFRYIRLDHYPETSANELMQSLVAKVVYSKMQRTGSFRTSNDKVNQLYDNVIWGQRSNFLDIPTDCPQRDERAGWTGDAQVFINAASYNYNVSQFFDKWLADLNLDQYENGGVPQIIPNCGNRLSSAAWGDAATIIPWRIYLFYNKLPLLKRQFDSMKRWVDYITKTTDEPALWTGTDHLGDWLGLDAPKGSYKGSSREDLIATAFYAHSTWLLIKAGRVLNKDVASYVELYHEIKQAFNQRFSELKTQTELALGLHFKLVSDSDSAAKKLVELIRQNNNHLTTGFVGTPYLLHALSESGYSQVAYDLLLQKTYPSWLYPVSKGATTIWEHWDGIKEDGSFWSPDMNSYNHYAYGAVADWMYENVGGIRVLDDHPGLSKIAIRPEFDQRLTWVETKLKVAAGTIEVYWKQISPKKYRIDVTSPVPFVFGHQDEKAYDAGNYVFYDQLN